MKTINSPSPEVLNKIFQNQYKYDSDIYDDIDNSNYSDREVIKDRCRKYFIKGVYFAEQLLKNTD